MLVIMKILLNIIFHGNINLVELKTIGLILIVRLGLGGILIGVLNVRILI